VEQKIVEVAVTQTQIHNIWWTLTYVVLPSIGGGYIFTMGAFKYLLDKLTKSIGSLNSKIDDLANNHLKDLKREIEAVNRRIDRMEDRL
jgi:hypothetical protein